jgi:hypothetical protein
VRFCLLKGTFSSDEPADLWLLTELAARPTMPPDDVCAGVHPSNDG